MDTKQCSKCGETKNIDAFAFTDKTHTKLRASCKACRLKKLPPKILPPEGTKTCIGCGETKNELEFRKQGGGRRRSRCKTCEGKKSLTVSDRFWTKIDKHEDKECWIWQGAQTSSGNGSFAINHWKTTSAHRFSYQIAFGEIPEKTDVRQSCSNKLCCNPQHLFLKPKMNIQPGDKKDLLTYIRPTEDRLGNGIVWEAKCDCGNITFVRPRTTRSCGCLHIISAKENGMGTRKYDPMIATARNVWVRYKTIDRAKEREMTIDFETFYTLSQENCYYCGSPPSNKANKAVAAAYASDFAKENGDFIYSGLDRLDSSKGHTPDNVVPCCRDCNRMKMDMSLEKFERLVEAIAERIRLRKAQQSI